MKSLLLLLAFLLFSKLLTAQEEDNDRNWGLGASFQGTQLDITIPIWITETSILSPTVMGIYVEDAGYDIGFGIGYKSYLKSSKVSPYFSPKAGVFINNPDKGKSLVDLYFGLGIGADYFFDPKFCIGVEAQLNGTKSDKMSARFGNPGGINLNTAAALNAIIYF